MGRSDTPHGSARLRWLPNALTAARLAALPVLLALLIGAEGTTSVSAGVIFAVVAVTDFLDGYLARRLGAETRFGRIADPLADRLLVAVGLVGLLVLGGVSPVAPVILLARDAVIVAGAIAVLRRGIDMRVDLAGEASSALTMVATGLAILFAGAWTEVALWLAVALALVTFVAYARRAAVLIAASETSTRP